MLGEYLLGIAFGSKPPVESHMNCSGLHLCGHQDFAKDVGRAFLGRRLALLSVRLRTASTYWNVPGKSGPHGELFFFLLMKEPVA